MAEYSSLEEAVAGAGPGYIGIDRGSGTWPRFVLRRAFQVGDAVVCSFNGDSYSEGIVTAVSPTGKTIKTSTGKRFYRKGNSGLWRYNGMWVLGFGAEDTRNPHI